MLGVAAVRRHISEIVVTQLENREEQLSLKASVGRVAHHLRYGGVFFHWYVCASPDLISRSAPPLTWLVVKVAEEKMMGELIIRASHFGA